MATINTATGPIDSSELGFTLSHEHVILTSAGIPQVFPDFVDRDGTIERAVRDLKAAHDAGVRTIIDVTTMDLGRDVELLATVSRESGVNIICATGIWIDIPRLFWMANVDSVAKLFVREIRDGMEATGIKPGVIKVATNVGGVTPEGEKILRAAARASLETGIPISTHTFAPERSGNEQMAIFEDEKLEPQPGLHRPQRRQHRPRLPRRRSQQRRMARHGPPDLRVSRSAGRPEDPTSDHQAAHRRRLCRQTHVRT